MCWVYANKNYLKIQNNLKKNIADIHVTHLKKIGEGNGTPLQYSCLENPIGGGAW